MAVFFYIEKELRRIILKKYLLKRLGESVIVLLLISFFSFAVIEFAPGDIASMYIKPGMTEEQIATVKARYKTDQSFGEKYIEWGRGMLKGDFGVSLTTKTSVIDEIGNRMPATLSLMGIALVLSVLLAIPFGLIAGYYKNRLPDRIISALNYIGMSVPQFWLGMIFIIIFAANLHWFPLSGMHAPGVHTLSDTAKHMVLPCLTLCITNMAPYVRYVRSSTIHELEEEYVLAAKARGSSPASILRKHVLKNSLLPVITLVGMNISTIVSGSFVLEQVFGWPGIGTYAISAIQGRDYPVIMAYTMIVGVVLVLGNLVADLLYAVADPRIRQGMDVKDE